MNVGKMAAEAFDPTDEMDDLDVGNRLKQFRRSAGLRLKDVADAAGCSESMLSKVENGQVSPSINMLHRLTKALGVTISSLFVTVEPETPFVQRRGRRPILGVNALRQGEGLTLESLTPYEIHGHLQAQLHTLAPGASSDGAISHDGEEVGYVIEGALELTVGDKTALLSAGDSFFFDSARAHQFRNPGNSVTRVVWVNSPPTY
ncbi:cupin domain-containing protein [Alphaproteobacteria bacterium GH1-50]|uniref:Cupin domain-containing protein n=2 Tax=Kangsaoukella pontilimi TaxID=2691042 RepID=A0A7C9IQQ9_9RHOB|nr:cupin domain-containing protein [Kangsaoukella pontilimi]